MTGAAAAGGATDAMSGGTPDDALRAVLGTAALAALPPAPADGARVLLVRHGVTRWNAEGRHQGRADVPLSDEGRAQAGALGALLRPLAVDAAYTSPLGRARDTAAAVLAGRARDGRALRATPVAEFAELSYGARAGERRADWLAADPAFVARWDEKPWAVTFPGGESLDDVRRRAAPAWDRVVRAHPGETVLVSAHGHLNRVLLVHALGLPPGTFWSLPQPNASCVVIDVRPEGASAAMLAP